MLLPNIFSNYQSNELPNVDLTSDNEAQVLADIRAWSTFFSRAVDLYISSLASTTTDASGSMGTGSAGGELQPYHEYSNTESTRVEENEWGWAAPIRRYRDRQVYTEEYLQGVTLAKLQEDVIAATNRSYTTRLKILIRAAFANTSYVFLDKAFPGQNRGPLTINPLFNADGSTARFYIENQLVSAGNLQSYLTTGTNGITLENFEMGRQGLIDRGLTGRVVHVCSRLDAPAVKLMTGFVPAPTGEAAYGRVTNSQDPVTAPIITAQREAIGTFFGGDADGEVVSWPFFPQGYTLSYDATKETPLVFRQHQKPEFQGFRLVQNETGAAYGEQALRNKLWEFIGGAAVKNRLNGIIVQGTTGAYAVPNIATS